MTTAFSKTWSWCHANGRRHLHCKNLSIVTTHHSSTWQNEQFHHN
jgi:hypothetical protein